MFPLFLDTLYIIFKLNINIFKDNRMGRLRTRCKDVIDQAIQKKPLRKRNSRIVVRGEVFSRTR